MKGLTEENLETLLETVKHRAVVFPRDLFRERLLACDKAYYMFDGKRDDEIDPETKELFISRYTESGFSIVSPAVEAEVAFMYALFLSDPKIFSVVSSEKYKDLARGIQAANIEHSRHTKWLKNLLKFFRDTAKYNLGFVTATWVQRETYIPVLNDQGDREELNPIIWEGNQVKRVDPYNAVFDHTVDISELAEHGEFFITCEAITQIELYKLLSSLKGVPENVGKVYNMNEVMWRSSNSVTPEGLKFKELDVAEVVPSFILNTDIKKDKNSWFEFAGITEDINKSKMPKSDSLYNLNVCYVRLVPELYGCKVPEEDKIQIWKVIIVNGTHVVYIGRETNVHSFLPVGAAQPIEDSLGQNTLGLVLPLRGLQELGKQLKDRRLASLDRNISDRAIYDPNSIDPADMKRSEGKSDAKIPLRPTAREIDLKRAYMSIPFTDTTSQLFDREVAFIHQQADSQTGINAASRGQFVKGNKTLEEYQDVMSNADSKQYARAAAIESQAFSDIKHIIKWNLVQYGKEQVFQNPITGEEIQLNEAELRKAVFNFKLSDGLNPSSKFLNTQEAIGLFQLLQIMAQQDQQQGVPSIDFNKMLSHILLQGKNIDIEEYIPTQTQSGGAGA